MPVLTRSQARTGQPPVLAASPRVRTPGRISRSQQTPRSRGTPRRVIRRSKRVGVSHGIQRIGGSPSFDLAEGSGMSTGSRSCRSDCMTCPKLVLLDEFTSNVTSRTYKIINNTKK